MYIIERFKLSKDNQEDLKSMKPKFGFNGFGEATYYRTYSRVKEDGTQEHWADTVIRVINGVFSILKNHQRTTNIEWDEKDMQYEAMQMATYMFEMKMLPPGRGLWVMGTNYIYDRGSMALFNCAFTTTVDLVNSAEWAMDALMCGVGVGFDTKWNGIASVPDKSDPECHIIGDDREGWVYSLELMLSAYCKKGKWYEFDYSYIRKSGEKIAGFGGTASGPEPLMQLHKNIEKTMDAYLDNKFDRTRVVADVFNYIGACVVAGNVRRSAQIALGDPDDNTFLNLKNYDLNPDRMEMGWMSNNTVRLEKASDFEKLDEIAERILDNGEPGIANIINMQKYARFGKLKPDKGIGTNPCLLPSFKLIDEEGLITLGEISIGDKIWSKEGWTTVTDKWCTGEREVYEYTTTAGTFTSTENHRVVQNGEKIEVCNAESIDVITGPNQSLVINQIDVIDGLMIGDGTRHESSRAKVFLNIGMNDHSYFEDSVSEYILDKQKWGDKDFVYEVRTTIIPSELAPLPEREIPQRFLYGTQSEICGFLRGLYSANGSVVSNRITLKATSFKMISAVQIMLNSVGIRSYYTTNKSKTVKWKNGEYKSKQSYDLNITSDRTLFSSKIGFIQPYKNNKITIKKVKGKTSYEIISKKYIGKHGVYDITVDNDSHTFWGEGFDVSNCGEIILEDKELCNLAEVFPTNCNSTEEFYNALRYATVYTTIVNLLPNHRSESSAVIARNRRLGVSISGIADYMENIGVPKMIKHFRRGYKIVEETNKNLSSFLGIPASVRLTTVKPSGTISQLAGVSSGMHFPVFKYAIRRMRVGTNAPICKVLKDAGVPNEPDQFSDNTTVFEFPIDQGKTREAKDVSAWEQFSLLAMIQREWADNMVSCTIYFDKEKEGSQVKQMLAMFAPVIKSVSMLPHSDGGEYPQMPYEGITKEEYDKRVAEMPIIDWKAFGGSDGMQSKFCTDGSCEL